MQITIDNDKVVNILQSLASQLDLTTDKVIELCIAFTDTDKVLSLGCQLSHELKLEATEQP